MDAFIGLIEGRHSDNGLPISEVPMTSESLGGSRMRVKPPDLLGLIY